MDWWRRKVRDRGGEEHDSRAIKPILIYISRSYVFVKENAKRFLSG